MNQVFEIENSLQDIIRERTASLQEQSSKSIRLAQVKSDFLASLSHEIRTPLHGVVGMVELLASTNLSVEQQELIDGIQSSSFIL